MGEYRNGKLAKVLGWLTAVIMAVAAIALFATGGVTRDGPAPLGQ